MHPRVVLCSVAGVLTDLLCLLGVAAVLLTNNHWIFQIGAARFWFVVLLVAIGVVPMMYARERMAYARQYGTKVERKPKGLPAWAGVDRSEHTLSVA